MPTNPAFRSPLLEADDQVFLANLTGLSALAFLWSIVVWSQPLPSTSIRSLEPQLVQLMRVPPPLVADVQLPESTRAIPEDLPAEPTPLENVDPPPPGPTSPVAPTPSGTAAPGPRGPSLAQRLTNSPTTSIWGKRPDGPRLTHVSERRHEDGLALRPSLTADPLVPSFEPGEPLLLHQSGMGIGGGPRVHVPVRMGTPELELDGDTTGVKRTVRRYLGQVKYCYEQALKRDPDVAGRIEVRWSVESGRAHDLQVVTNSTGHEELANCVQSRVARWRFPNTVEGEVTWPFVFRRP